MNIRFFSALIFFLSLNAATGGTNGSLSVAVVMDGPSPVYSALVEDVEEELGRFDDLRIQLRVAEHFNAGWQPERVPAVLNAALEDPAIDVVLAMGGLVILEAADPGRKLDKPVVARILGGDSLFALEPKAGFAPVLSEYRIHRDVSAMKDLFRIEKLHVMVDRVLADNLPGINELAERISAEMEMPVEMIAVDEGAQDALNAVPGDAEALYVTFLPRMGDAERAAVYEGLSDRGVFTFAMMGQRDIEAGALAGLAPETRPRLARRLALNLLALADGRPVSELPRHLVVPEQLMLNRRTMSRVGYRPSVGVYLQTRLVESLEEETGEPLTMEAALDRALELNTRIDRKREERLAAEQERRMARGTLFPQVEAEAAHMQIDRKRAEASYGLQPRTRTEAGVSLRQVVFDDEVFSRARAAALEVSRREWQERETTLDVTRDAALRFFDALSAEALLKVEIDRLERIRDNLEFARLRVDLGATGPEDLLRWESEEARRTAAVLSARADRKAARAALNQVMGFEPDAPWKLESVDIADTETYFLDDEINLAAGSFQVLLELADFWRDVALRESPSLQALDSAIKAQEIVTGSKRRARYLPSIAVRAQYDHIVDRQTEGDIARSLAAAGLPVETGDYPDDHWSIGIAAELPVFDGGLRRAAHGQAAADLRRLEVLREEARQKINAGVVAAYARVTSSQPAIRLHKTRARTARESMDLVQERYDRGAAGIIEVLDAQGRAYAAEQAVVIAVNGYLQDLAVFQHAISWFAWLRTSDEQTALADEIRAYLEKKK